MIRKKLSLFKIVFIKDTIACYCSITVCDTTVCLSPQLILRYSTPYIFKSQLNTLHAVLPQCSSFSWSQYLDICSVCSGNTAGCPLNAGSLWALMRIFFTFYRINDLLIVKIIDRLISNENSGSPIEQDNQPRAAVCVN